ncbi:MAG: diaminopimelate epimerase [Fimbriimonadales bacterium]|nr:diaminopimelate epimerase [Fimbriimonadales bacterium]
MSARLFFKLQGNGNDFVLLDALDATHGWQGSAEETPDWSQWAVRLCDRRFGVGADGLLILERGERAPYRMRIFNPDGSEAEMCGNGIRCFAHYLLRRYAPQAESLAIETGAGVRVVRRADEMGRMLTVEMGAPRLARCEVPVRGEPFDQPMLQEPVAVADTLLQLSAVNTGTPHAVLFTPDVQVFPLERLGPAIEHHPLFPERANVQVAQVVRPDYAVVRTWERGAGATLACGTGACAVLVVGHLLGLLERRATIRMPGGELHIEWREDNQLLMTGPAVEVFEGRWLSEQPPT